AMRAVPDTRPIQTVLDAIAAAKRLLRPGKQPDPAIWMTAKNTADRLMDFTGSRLEEIRSTIESEIGQTRVFVAAPELPLPELLPLPYEPNTSVYQQTRSLSIGTERAEGFPDWAHNTIYAHAVGSKFRGLIGFVSVFSSAGINTMTSREPFQTSYAEPYESAERRFRPWLEESLVNALTLWRKSL